MHGIQSEEVARLPAVLVEKVPATIDLSRRRLRIFIAESHRFSDVASKLLGELGEVVLADVDRATLLANIGDVAVLWVRLRHRIDAQVLRASTHLRVVVTPTTGLNHIDQREAARRGVQILSLRGEADFLKEVRATAEHTIGMALALLRHVPAAGRHVQQGGWNRDLFWGHELHGKVVGIVGYGRLGRLVGEYLLPFGARVVASDVQAPSVAPSPGVRMTSLEALLKESDLVTIHVNVTPASTGFFGRNEFALMKRGAWFINTARGELVDESALLEALTSGWLAGAAIDVLAGERAEGMGDNPLVQYARDHDDLLVTPHIGGCTWESIEKTEVFMAEKLRAFLRSNPL